MLASWRKHCHYQIIHSLLTENVFNPVINGHVYTLLVSYYISNVQKVILKLLSKFFSRNQEILH